MTLHPQELQLARAYQDSQEFEELSPEQMKRILDRGRELQQWFRAHARIHNLISAAAIAWIFGADAAVLLGLPRVMLADGRQASLAWILGTALVTGMAHCWLLYSLAVYSLHEGAAHHLIFSARGWVGKAGEFAGRNLCRFGLAEPDYYASCHMTHHARFATEHDAEFLNFIIPHRFWLAFLPYAAFINFTDFLIHRPLTYTRSRVISSLVSAVYNGVFGYLMVRAFGWTFTLLTLLVILPHVGFYLDRLRQYCEHNLMPLDNRNGARSFGVGFWGLLIGGGPWGQPCHWIHHLVPSIPWYQQISLHFYVKGILTERQRRQFLLAPVVGFPLLLFRLVRDTGRFARRADFHPNAAAQP